MHFHIELFYLTYRVNNIMYLKYILYMCNGRDYLYAIISKIISKEVNFDSPRNVCAVTYNILPNVRTVQARKWPSFRVTLSVQSR